MALCCPPPGPRPRQPSTTELVPEPAPEWGRLAGPDTEPGPCASGRLSSACLELKTVPARPNPGRAGLERKSFSLSTRPWLQKKACQTPQPCERISERESGGGESTANPENRKPRDYCCTEGTADPFSPSRPTIDVNPMPLCTNPHHSATRPANTSMNMDVRTRTPHRGRGRNPVAKTPAPSDYAPRNPWIRRPRHAGQGSPQGR